MVPPKGSGGRELAQVTSKCLCLKEESCVSALLAGAAVKRRVGTQSRVEPAAIPGGGSNSWETPA